VKSESKIFLNNAATSFPKPEVVANAVLRALHSPPTEPSRGGRGVDHVTNCRRLAANLFDVPSIEQVILTHSGTLALNLALFGSIEHGHVVATVFEHNSVLRPLAELRRRAAVDVTFVPPDAEGRIRVETVLAACRPDTRAVVVNHCSNVTGAIVAIPQLAKALAGFRCTLIVDISQSAGTVEMSYASLPGRVVLAGAGHKALLGPSGTGLLIVPKTGLRPILFGGTGTLSDQEYHPLELPLRHEAGTANVHGLAGLAAGLAYIIDKGFSTLAATRTSLLTLAREQLGTIDGLWLSPLPDNDGRAGIVSFCLQGWEPDALAATLNDVFDIEVRSGLHCAPLAHRALGTHPKGTVRVSVGPFNTENDIMCLTRALQQLASTTNG
jgi:selenocysteine lyase/cysteine desulfurase